MTGALVDSSGEGNDCLFALGLRCCTPAFSGCGEWELLFGASPCGDFSPCGATGSGVGALA